MCIVLLSDEVPTSVSNASSHTLSQIVGLSTFDVSTPLYLLSTKPMPMDHRGQNQKRQGEGMYWGSIIVLLLLPVSSLPFFQERSSSLYTNGLSYNYNALFPILD